MYWDSDAVRYLCRLASQPSYRYALAMGQGCCARFNTWRKDVRNRDPI